MFKRYLIISVLILPVPPVFAQNMQVVKETKQSKETIESTTSVDKLKQLITTSQLILTQIEDEVKKYEKLANASLADLLETFESQLKQSTEEKISDDGWFLCADNNAKELIPHVMNMLKSMAQKTSAYKTSSSITFIKNCLTLLNDDKTLAELARAANQPKASSSSTSVQVTQSSSHNVLSFILGGLTILVTEAVGIAIIYSKKKDECDLFLEILKSICHYSSH